MKNWQDTILSQFGNSPILLSLIESANDAIDPAANIDAFITSVWDVSTAQGHGLDIWGRIVGISRYIQIPGSIDYFGFKTGGTPEHSLPFGSGVFYAGQQVTQTYALSDAAFRQLILFKAFSNIAAMNIPTLNKLVQLLFAGVVGYYVAPGYVVDGYFATTEPGRAYVLDLGGMTMRYVFDIDLTAYQVAIVNAPGVLPRPAGVTVIIG